MESHWPITTVAANKIKHLDCPRLNIRLHQKTHNKYAHLPWHSFHQGRQVQLPKISQSLSRCHVDDINALGRDYRDFFKSSHTMLEKARVHNLYLKLKKTQIALGRIYPQDKCAQLKKLKPTDLSSVFLVRPRRGRGKSSCDGIVRSHAKFAKVPSVCDALSKEGEENRMRASVFTVFEGGEGRPSWCSLEEEGCSGSPLSLSGRLWRDCCQQNSPSGGAERVRNRELVATLREDLLEANAKKERCAGLSRNRREFPREKSWRLR